MHTPSLRFCTPVSASELDGLRHLLREYAATLAVQLPALSFAAELADLPGPYAEPRGALITAWLGSEAVGCCLLRPFDAGDAPNSCEMKHLFVRPAFRGRGLGRQLAEHTLDAARLRGYACLLLDTHVDMEAARALYEDLGFVEIPPYHQSPFAGAHYLQVRLD